MAMINEILLIDEQGKITLPKSFLERFALKNGSKLILSYNDTNNIISLSLPNNDNLNENIKPFKSGFGMLKTNLSVKDLDVDVAQFAKDI